MRSSHFANVFSWGLGNIHQRDPDRETGTEYFGVKMHCSPKSEEVMKIAELKFKLLFENNCAIIIKMLHRFGQIWSDIKGIKGNKV